ncbi:transmembrane protein 131-like isoform X2 [Mya arenaria]|uniref:transmembrane protein 131-like isoform X2 n=1 Tax=Mya arenaria TaxID=6604 RepID=UPI0022E901DB|nr:transmembrane protein 131-like isoform X2 [Mya arenaria]XP_052793070.1 transmembrane protein 131-like isoform X2 [Mya arenaria]XP_052793071.1 transmembrane protein 131-like isoform X2 [Mya arenaria]
MNIFFLVVFLVRVSSFMAYWGHLLVLFERLRLVSGVCRSYCCNESGGLAVKPGPIYNDPDELLIPSAINFDPAMLDFHDQPVGMPRMEQVTVHNTDGKNNLHLLSISGSTAHFHCSFFQDKIVPPGGNTTFDVVFLARQEGNVENTLYIHTSLGSFKYQVFGVGTANPYRLRPYLGARVPVNSSFAPLINMHNPHSTTLQVLEIFSSEGDLHLELPTGEKEAPRSLWEIPPYETKTIMKANFVGRTENNHTAFIRIKTDHKKEKQLLVLPMEVEVTSTPGIYLATELIDFGIVRTFDEPKTVPVNLINTGRSVVPISSVTVHPPNEAISVDFRPIKLQPDLLRQTTVARITFRASKAINPKFWSGKIIIRSKNNVHKISIPYEAKVLHGSLTYHKNSTFFFAHNHPLNHSRYLLFTNTFNFSLVLYNVTLPPEVHHIFSIWNFTKPVLLPPQQHIAPFVLRFHTYLPSLHFKTVLSLHTNASIFEIPLIIYNGQLKIKPHDPQKLEGQLDFGTMGVKENRSVLFTLINDNPIELYLYEYSTDMKGASIQILGIERGNGTVLTRQHNISAVNTDPVMIPPYHFAVLSLKLVAPEEEGQYQAEVIIATPYQDTFIPVTVRTSEGSLHAIPERVVFDKVFPGKIPMKVLQVHSTFHDYMGLKSVLFQPADPRFYFVMNKNEYEAVTGDKMLVLEPQTNNTIGKIFYDFKKECREECYVGISTQTPAGHRWAQGLELDRETPETDEYLYKHLRDRWRVIQDQGKDRVNVTIEIDTNTVQGFLFSAHVQHHWPDIIRKCRSRFKFPLTQIGNMSTLDILLENTGDIPVIVQVVPLHLYPNPQTIIDLLKHDLPSHFSEYVETDDPDIFSLSELAELNARVDSAVNRYRQHVDSTLGVASHRKSLTVSLEKGAKVKVQIGFTPKDDIFRTSLIIVRNNLTIIDAVVLEGQGGRGELKLNNKKPGISSLQFDIAEKHLKYCDRRKHNKNTIPNFTVKRSFTLRNTGELPFYVHGYNINNVQCEGYGFRVLDCTGYEMKPNSSRKIDIAFTPDFTMSRVQRTLTIFTSLGQAFNYTLQATVPIHTLSKCSSSLPRPNWEPVLYYSIVCVMGFLLFCILVASYFEADRIFVADILKRKVKLCNGTPPYQRDKIFDLKALGASTYINGISPPPSPQNRMMLPPSLLNKVPRPNLDIPNGHIEHKVRDSIWMTISSILKSLFVRKPAARKRPASNVESPPTLAPSTPDSSPSTEQNHVQPEKEIKPVVHENISPEKSTNTASANPQQPQKITLRKTKAAKRSHTEATPSPNAQATSSYERKPSKSNTTVTEKKVTETPATVQTVTPTPIVTKQEPTMILDFEDTKIDISKAGKGRKKLKSRQERDVLVKDRLAQRPAEDKDETSSTTTESSTGDIDDKPASPAPQVSESPEPTPPQPKASRKKSKGKNLEPLIMPTDEDFELTSKSRAYKKIKGQYGGEIPTKSGTSLEIDLPYNIEKTKNKKKKTNNANNDLDKLTKSKPKGYGLDHLDDITLETHLSESDSPAPSWDEPHPASPSDDFMELSVQTDKFARGEAKTTDAISPPSNLSPNGLTSLSRSSSYSSIVSNSSGETKGEKTKGDKRYPAGFTPFSNTGIEVPLSTAVNSRKNAWGTGSNTAPGTPETLGGFGLQTITEGNTLTSPQTSFSFGLPTPSSTTDSGFGFPQASTGFGSLSSDEHLTMMQKLQLERKQRVLAHNQQKRITGWPGFDEPLPSNTPATLWENEYNPFDQGMAWATAPDTPPESSQAGIWSTLTNSANSSWNSLLGIWGGASTSTSPTPLTTTPNFNLPGPSPSNQDQPQENLFDPFNSPIWAPNASTGSTGWNLPAPGTQAPNDEGLSN